MEYQDEKIAALMKERQRLRYTDIKGEGVFINGKFMKFGPRKINDNVELYIPEDFIDMPEEIRLMKFPSVFRPQMILTSLDGSINFTFNIVEDQASDQIESLTAQMKEVVQKSNPAAIFYQEEYELLEGGTPVCMFDFKNFSIDGPMYNMVCFAGLHCGTLHGTFICLDQDAEDWKAIAWDAFKSLTETNVKD